MKPDRDDRDEGSRSSTLPAMLRREALESRPDFSSAFHERLMERIAGEMETCRSEPTPSLPTVLAHHGRSRVGVALVAVSLLVLVAVLVVAGRRLGESPMGPDMLKREAAVARAAAVTPGEEPAGIETMPFYDDLESELRAGVWMLAESLVELPDWASLADFDAFEGHAAGELP